MIDAECGRRIALRVKVDHEHSSATVGESRCEVDRRCRLADATLLVRDGDDPRLSRQRELLRRNRAAATVEVGDLASERCRRVVVGR